MSDKEKNYDSLSELFANYPTVSPNNNNKAVLEVIKNQTREYTDLLKQHNTLMKVHAKTVNNFADSEKKSYDLRKQNKDLRALVVRFERDNERLQESLDQAERELMDK